MKEAKINKPDIVQSFDFYEDRVYYKIVNGFFFSHERVVRTDRLENFNVWKIECEKLPDKIFINGKEYQFPPHPVTEG